ncbi:MAG: hypothetical protein LKG20_12805 [Tetrasphaera jenkinsii]|jgi:hypothetical protein|nr:hypothetical protein [Tetrasphaera jenkinsii]
MTPPSFLSRRAVELVTLALPSGPVRNRYRLELLSELEQVPARERAAYLLRVAGRMPSLAAVTVGPDRPILTGNPPRYPSIRCRLHLGHRWSQAYTEDGRRYLRCHNCGEDRRGSSPAPENALCVGNVGGGMGGMT